MPSPYVRRLRLGNELRDLRKAAGLTADQLARRIGESRLKISRLETGARKPDVADVMKVLETLGIDEGTDRWRELVRVARDAAARGWWETQSFSDMGGQARWADVESGATSMRIYESHLIPGLVQTESYVRARNDIVAGEGAVFNHAVTVAGRLRRQEEFTQKPDRTMAVILEEQAIRRLVVPREVMAEQLQHLIGLVEHDQITLGIVPVEVELLDVRAPRAPFTICTYDDPHDPVVVLLDQVAASQVLIEPDEVGPYLRLFDRLTAVALSSEDTLTYLVRALKAINSGTRSRTRR
ncbi:transcriptional regulator [Virgisporangium aliadipatigenens]|uniref:Transcriptional regulator n=1 Tax=Virgisporangium aliadipatigenens TaxID=741659 RepID=A0A8J3YP95_9ACTN|nr:helix-turn-helix transcriptional regulator [Virgisporangium aliadipatigenens]GIJ47303.1 transcriptional regulator [Virgisporangium aliadipatigenens]